MSAFLYLMTCNLSLEACQISATADCNGMTVMLHRLRLELGGERSLG